MSSYLDVPIDELHLSVRTQNMLRHYGLCTVRQVLERDLNQLLGLRNFGRAQLFELKTKLHERGYLMLEDEPRLPAQPSVYDALLSWGPPAQDLLRGGHDEAVRHGHATIVPAHFMLSVLRQSVVTDLLVSLGQYPDIGAIQHTFIAAVPVGRPVLGEVSVSAEGSAILQQIRPHKEGEDDNLVYIQSLKLLLTRDALCRSMAAAGVADVSVVERALERVT